MPLTNPNKVVTEERLSEFYGQILPYMGGMPDVLANKFNKSDIISTTETLVGTASNGKPLYQIYIQASSVSSLNVFYTVPDGEDIFILWAQYCKNDSTIDWLNMNGYDSNSSSTSRCQVGIKGNNIKMLVPIAGSSHPVRMLIQYTKTTDSPIAIGSDTDYSTTEKIVGTWIDGKPVYQKVVVGNNLAAGSSTSIAHGISNLGEVISVYGSAKRSNGYWQEVPGTWYGGLNYTLAFTDVTSTNMSFQVGSGYTGDSAIVKAYAVIQYTKTS